MSEKNPGGRPTKYKEEYCQAIIDYFNRPYTIDKETSTTSGGRVLKINTLESCDIPSLEGFARSIEVDADTLQNWAKKHEKFFGALKRAKDIQKDIITNNAMKGHINQTFAIFYAKCNWGWNDGNNKQQEPRKIEITVKEFEEDSKPVQETD